MSSDTPAGQKTDVPLYFLILGLTPLLGVSHSFIHSLLLGSFLGLLLFLQAPLLALLGFRLSDKARFPVVFLVNFLLVALLDLGTTAFLPALAPGFGPYLKLLAVNPLILRVLLREGRSWGLGEALGFALKSTFGFLMVAGLLSLSREILGAGRITWGLGGEQTVLPVWSDLALKALVASSGGAFLLAGLWKALQNYGYQKGALFLKQEEPLGSLEGRKKAAESSGGMKQSPVSPVSPAPGEVQDPAPKPERSPAPPAPPEASSPDPAPGTPESTPVPPVASIPAPPAAPVRETPEGAFQALVQDKSFEKKRILILGCGTGEALWQRAIVLTEGKKTNPRFSFRIRGVDSDLGVLDTAKEGAYEEYKLEPLTLDQKKRYLLLNTEGGQRMVKVGGEVRPFVEFQGADYQVPDYFFLKPADIIQVSDHLVAPSREQKLALVELCAQHLLPGGALLIPLTWVSLTPPDTFQATGSRVWRRRESHR